MLFFLGNFQAISFCPLKTLQKNTRPLGPRGHWGGMVIYGEVYSRFDFILFDIFLLSVCLLKTGPHLYHLYLYHLYSQTSLTEGCFYEGIRVFLSIPEMTRRQSKLFPPVLFFFGWTSQGGPWEDLGSLPFVGFTNNFSIITQVLICIMLSSGFKKHDRSCFLLFTKNPLYFPSICQFKFFVCNSLCEGFLFCRRSSSQMVFQRQPFDKCQLSYELTRIAPIYSLSFFPQVILFKLKVRFS